MHPCPLWPLTQNMTLKNHADILIIPYASFCTDKTLHPVCQNSQLHPQKGHHHRNQNMKKTRFELRTLLSVLSEWIIYGSDSEWAFQLLAKFIADSSTELNGRAVMWKIENDNLEIRSDCILLRMKANWWIFWLMFLFRVIQQSHPVCNTIMLFGVITCLISVILLGIDGQFVDSLTYPVVSTF